MAEQAVLQDAGVGKPVYPGARAPVCRVLVNTPNSVVRDARQALPGTTMELSGVLEAEVINNSYQSADTFRVRVALSAAPAWFTVDYLTSAFVVPVEIMIGPTPDDVRSLLLGQVDDIEYDPVENTVELYGRDYTSFLIDSRSSDLWLTWSASQVAIELAERNGLDTALIEPTEGPVNEAVAAYMSRVGDGRTDWDLLNFLAGQIVDGNGNSFVTYVTGRQLYFGPRPESSDYLLQCEPATRAGQRFRIKPATDPAQGPAWGGLSLNFSRNVSVLRNVSVEMCSAQIGERKSQLVRFSPPESRAGKTQVYSFKAPLDVALDWLEKQAQARQQDIARHQMSVSFVLPGDSVLTQSSLLTISGLGNSFDQTYFVQSVTRRFSPRSGYVMEGSAQNCSIE